MCAALTPARSGTSWSAKSPGVKISETPMMRGRFIRIGDTPVEAVKAERQCRLGVGRRPRRDLRRKAAGRFRDRRRDMVAGRLFRAAAGLDGEGSRATVSGSASATRSSSTCSAAISLRRSRICGKSIGAASRSISCWSIRPTRSRARLHRTRLRGAAVPAGREAELALLRAAARLFPRSPASGARSAGKRRSFGRQARAAIRPRPGSR